MKKTLVKVFSIILALVCLLSVFGAAGNIKDVLNAKDYWENVREEALASFDEMDDGIAQLTANLQTYLDGVETYEDGLAQYQEGLVTLEEGRKSVAEGEAKLAAGQAEFDAGAEQLAQGHADYEQGLKDLEEGRGQLRYGEQKYYTGLATLEEGKKTYAEGMETYKANEALLKDAEGQLEAKRPEYEAGKQKIQQVEPLVPLLKGIDGAYDRAASNYDKAVASGNQLAAGWYQMGKNLFGGDILGLGTASDLVDQYTDGKAQIDLFESNEALLNDKKEQLAAGKETLDAAADQIAAGEAELAAGEQSLALGYGSVYEGEVQLAEAKILLAENDEKLAAAKLELEQGKKDLEAGKQQVADGEKQLAEAEIQLADGKAQLKVFEDGEDQLAAGIDQAVGTDTYYDKYGNALVKSIAGRLGRNFSYWTLDNGKEVLKNEHKLLDLEKAAEVPEAGRAFVADNGDAVTKEMVGRIISVAAAAIAAVAGLIAALLGLFGKLKPSTVLGIIASAASVVGVMYAVIAASDLPYSKIAEAVHGQSMPVVLGVLAAAAVAFTAVAFAAKRSEEAELYN